MPPLFEYPVVVSLVDQELVGRQAQAAQAHATATAALKVSQASEKPAAILDAQVALARASAAVQEARQWASERNLAGAYHEMTTTLTERAKQGSSTCRMMCL